MNATDMLEWIAAQGGRFALPRGRTKGTGDDGRPTLEKGWQNIHHTLDEAKAHSQRLGNVGLLTGAPAGNIIAVDRDINFPETVELLGDLGKTAKIRRSNAPSRGKFLYRVTGELPKSTNWKENLSDDHPAVELLSTGRHAIIPPSVYKEGLYLLEDTQFGIMEVNEMTIDAIWWSITGEHLAGHRAGQTATPGERGGSHEFVDRVRSAWSNTVEVFEHFGKTGEGITKRGEQLHIRGNSGLLVKGHEWFCHSAGVGGDQLDAWSFCKTGKKLDRADAVGFWDTVNEMADAAGIEKPQVVKAGQAKAPRPKRRDGTEGVSDRKKYSESVAELLTGNGYSFAWNELDDSIEVNGCAMNDGIEARIAVLARDSGCSVMESVRNVYVSMAYANTYHPVKKYLGDLEWNGKDHILELSKHFDNAHEPIVYENGDSREVFHAWLHRWLVGSIAKIFETGTRAQNPMLVIDGAQGKGKSTFVKWLGSPLPKLTLESEIKPDDKEQKRLLATMWIWEVGELGSTTRRADREALKQFLTMQESTFRKPYSRNPVTKPAMASFIGTINNENGFLSDPTGNRRYNCAKVVDIRQNYKENVDINQVWAQAYALYKNGEGWKLTPEEILVRDEINGGEYTREDPYQAWILKHFDVDPSKNEWLTTTAEIADHLAVMGVKGETRAVQMGASDTLKSLGLRQHSNARPRVWIGIRKKM